MSAQTVDITVPRTGKTIRVPTGLFINNEFVASVDSKETIPCVFHVHVARCSTPFLPLAPCARVIAPHGLFYYSTPAIPPAFFPQPCRRVRLNPLR